MVMEVSSSFSPACGKSRCASPYIWNPHIKHREMAVGNTFGATALSSYGGFWISYAIILTPGGFGIIDTYTADNGTTLDDALGFFLAGWFIFTTMLLFCTLRSTVAFFLLFFFLDMA